MLQALLIDDELNNLNNLAFMLQHDCSGVEVAGKVTNAAMARDWLQQHKADVLFLDINMPGENGFDFLKTIAAENYKIIFVTAYNEFALQAIKASALDYIVKPINIEELQAAVEKLKAVVNLPASLNQNKQLLEQLLASVQTNQYPKKIALPQLGGMSFIEVDDIVSLQADSNYTIIHMNNMQKLVISKTLKDFEELLDADRFVRIHKSYMVHLKYIKEYSTIDGGVVKMNDGNQWSISRRQLDLFLEKMKASSLMFNK